MPTAALDLMALPDQLLGRILGLAGASRQDWPAIVFTCKRWCSLFFSEPSKWRRFGLGTEWLEDMDAAGQQERLAGLKCFLQRNAGAVEQLSIDDENGVLDSAPAGLQLPDFLGLPLPWALSSLRLWCGSGVPDTAAQPLLRFLALTHLDLGSWEPLPAAVTAVFSQLPQPMQSLRLHMGRTEKPELAAAIELTHLTHLTFDVFTFKVSVPLQRLTALQQLRKLWLRETVSDNEMLPQLVFPSTARFPKLQECLYLSGAAAVVLDGVAGCGFKACYLHTEPAQQQPGQATAAAAATLELHMIQWLAAAGPLLQALLPPNLHLACLCLSSSPLVPGAWIDCTQLDALPALHLKHCKFQGSADAALEPLLHQASCLAELGLRSCLEPSSSGVGHAALPACVAAKRGLTALYAPGNHLSDLPKGAFLKGLRVVDLSRNALHYLPPSLAKATSLESLRLSNNPNLVLDAADVDATLARLHCLALLEVQNIDSLGLVFSTNRLRRRRPQLVIAAEGASRDGDGMWAQGLESDVLDAEPFQLVFKCV